MSIVYTSNEKIRDIEKLLYREASLLDQADLDAWINLYTDDGTYWMPVTPDQADPINHISLFYDDRAIMEIRRRNMSHPRAASKDLSIRSSHIIGNIQVRQQAQDGDMSVDSNFHCVVYHNNEQTLYAGTYRHDLVMAGDQLQIKNKRVDIINCDAVLPGILIYI